MYNKNNNNIVITDFGISTLIDLTETKKTLIGTFGFIAPELDQGVPYTDKADIFSLGRLCIQLAHGKHINGIRVNDLKQKKKYSPDFINFIERCVVDDPNKRASLEELKNVPLYL